MLEIQFLYALMRNRKCLNYRIQFRNQMGAVKSITHSYAANQYLYWHIQRKDIPKIIQILDQKPELINQSLTVNYKTTPLHRAAVNGNLEIVKLLIQRYKADVEFKTSTGETPLMGAVKRDKYQIVCHLLDSGANPDVISTTGLTALDYAILQGNYECAMEVNAKVKISKPKHPNQYFQLAYRYKYRFVDYDIVIEGLENKTKAKDLKDYLTKPKRKYNDPVVDPREPWRQWFLRNLEMQDPPMVQRSNLPEDLQPQNRKFAKLRHLVTKMTISPLCPKPSFLPRAIQQAQSDCKMNELRSQVISEAIDVKSAV